jgi:hypothetical protein
MPTSNHKGISRTASSYPPLKARNLQRFNYFILLRCNAWDIREVALQIKLPWFLLKCHFQHVSISMTVFGITHINQIEKRKATNVPWWQNDAVKNNPLSHLWLYTCNTNLNYLLLLSKIPTIWLSPKLLANRR